MVDCSPCFRAHLGVSAFGAASLNCYQEELGVGSPLWRKWDCSFCYTQLSWWLPCLYAQHLALCGLSALTTHTLLTSSHPALHLQHIDTPCSLLTGLPAFLCALPTCDIAHTEGLERNHSISIRLCYYLLQSSLWLS